MAYLGNSPARSFISFERQVFTIVNSQTAYTLNHSVTNENDIRLVVNNIVQEPGSGKAYTASGTTLTLSAALVNGTDEMYCVYLGRATATEAPGAGSVGTSQLASDAVTEAKIADGAVESEHLNDNVISGQTALGATPADTDEILISDAGTLKRVDYSYLKSDNTPAFHAYLSANQTVSDATDTKCQFDTEVLDTDNCYDNSTNYRFTPTVAGKYFVYSQIACNANGANDFLLGTTTIKKNGSNIIYSQFDQRTSANGYSNTVVAAGIVDMNGSSDYLESFGYIDDDNTGSSPRLSGNSTAQYSNFGAYRIIE